MPGLGATSFFSGFSEGFANVLLQKQQQKREDKAREQDLKFKAMGALLNDPNITPDQHDEVLQQFLKLGGVTKPEDVERAKKVFGTIRSAAPAGGGAAAAPARPGMGGVTMTPKPGATTAPGMGGVSFQPMPTRRAAPGTAGVSFGANGAPAASGAGGGLGEVPRPKTMADLAAERESATRMSEFKEQEAIKQQDAMALQQQQYAYEAQLRTMGYKLTNVEMTGNQIVDADADVTGNAIVPDGHYKMALNDFTGQHQYYRIADKVTSQDQKVQLRADELNAARQAQGQAPLDPDQARQAALVDLRREDLAKQQQAAQRLDEYVKLATGREAINAETLKKMQTEAPFLFDLYQAKTQIAQQQLTKLKTLNKKDPLAVMEYAETTAKSLISNVNSVDYFGGKLADVRDEVIRQLGLDPVDVMAQVAARDKGGTTTSTQSPAAAEKPKAFDEVAAARTWLTDPKGAGLDAKDLTDDKVKAFIAKNKPLMDELRRRAGGS